MVRWIFRLVLIGVLVVVGYGTFQTWRKGYFNIPDMPDGSYVFSFKSGMRGIILDAEVSNPFAPDQPKILRTLVLADPDRSYFGMAFKVAPWIVNAWSTCALPSDEERIYFQERMPEDVKLQLEHARFDAVCVVDVDGVEVLRGLVYSVPKL